jgi:hypothetical protein
MIIKETQLFQKLWADLGMTDTQREELRNYLHDNPEAGDLIPKAKGTRKLRWKLNNNKGKSGGQRVIYVYYKSYEILYLLMTYSKSDQENLKESEKDQLGELVDKIKKVLKGNTTN